MLGILAIIIAYLLGAVPFGYLLVKISKGADVRASGSGNIGATNVLRTTGRTLGMATLLLDIGKGFAAVWITARLTDDSALWMSVAALAAMAGHAFPVFLGFKGGKAVASFIGAFSYLTPLPLAAVLVLFVAVIAFTRFVSLASVIAAAAFPFGVWIILHPELPVVVAAFVAGTFIIYRHEANLSRLRDGTENRFTWKKS